MNFFGFDVQDIPEFKVFESKKEVGLLSQLPKFEIANEYGHLNVIFDLGLHHSLAEHIAKQIRRRWLGTAMFSGVENAIIAHIHNELEKYHNNRVLIKWYGGDTANWAVDLRLDKKSKIDMNQVEHCKCCKGVLIRGDIDLEGSNDYAGVVPAYMTAEFKPAVKKNRYEFVTHACA